MSAPETNRRRLWRTSAVRLALRYVLGYLGLLGGTALLLLWTTSRYFDAETEQRLASQLEATAALFQLGQPDALVDAVNTRSQPRPTPDDEGGLLWLYVDRTDLVLAGSLRAWPDGIDPDAGVQGRWLDDELLPDKSFDDDVYWPVAATQFPDGSRLMATMIVEQNEDLHEWAEYLFEVFWVAGLLALLIGVTIGRRILLEVDRIGATAGEIMAGDLARRVPLSGRGDEFDALAQRLNAMLDRVQQLVRGIREVSDNIAHDLRSPLTRLRSNLEVVNLEPRDGEEYREAIRQAIDESSQLLDTFNALLSIAQAEAGSRRTRWERVDLAALAGDVIELYQPFAEEQQQRLELHGGDGLCVDGSRDLLAQALGNLIENAIKYTPAGGLVSLRVARENGHAEIRVCDSGPGIPAADRQRVLERFVRLESAREQGGNGLGLSLVAAVCKLHRAELTLSDADPGLCVHLRMPLRGGPD